MRYKQTMLGAGWAVIQPFFTMVVFSIFFGNFAKIPSEGLPYPIFSYAALVPWSYFAYALSQASNAMVAQRSIITKVYFPRLVVPVSSMLSGLPDFAISFAVLVVMMLYYGILPTANALLVPVLLFFLLATALAVGLWLSALNAIYRDVQFAVPFLIQFWLFASPIAYPSSLVPERWRWLYGLNPMAGVVEGFRSTLLGTKMILGPMFFVSVSVVFIILLTGLLYFRRVERSLADLI